MKCLQYLICFTSLVLSANATAALIDRGGGLIYDIDLDITWLADANYAMTSSYDIDGKMTWQESVAWANQLNYGGFTGWRLPSVTPINGVQFNFNTNDYDGTDDGGWNVGAQGTIYAGSTSSEYAHLFYTTLVNSSSYNLDGTSASCSPTDCLTNIGPFTNLQAYQYWAETGSTYDMAAAWVFVFDNGRQDETNKYNEYYAWAVHDGDIGAVPLPASLYLFLSGFVGMIGIAMRDLKMNIQILISSM